QRCPVVPCPVNLFLRRRPVVVSRASRLKPIRKYATSGDIYDEAFAIAALLARAARHGPELGATRLAFEIARGDERSGEIDRVADDRRHDEPLRAVRLAKRVEVLRELDFVAKGYAVRAQITGLQIRRRDFERTAFRAGARLS